MWHCLDSFPVSPSLLNCILFVSHVGLPEHITVTTEIANSNVPSALVSSSGCTSKNVKSKTKIPNPGVICSNWPVPAGNLAVVFWTSWIPCRMRYSSQNLSLLGHKWLWLFLGLSPSLPLEELWIKLLGFITKQSGSQEEYVWNTWTIQIKMHIHAKDDDRVHLLAHGPLDRGPSVGKRWRLITDCTLALGTNPANMPI